MRLAITGGTGLVGQFLVAEALAAGDDVTILSRSAPRPGQFAAPVAHRPYDLSGPLPDLSGFDALIHAAFAHEPGKYRGGEGDDPDGFLRRNLDGSVALFDAARAAGLSRVLFLSSRAVYGEYPPGTRLVEDLEPRPDTLYGKVKLQAEQALAALTGPGFATASLRATGVYGPGRDHKWCAMFADFRAGRPIAPRVATELHGDDLAAAARLLLTAPADVLAPHVFNASDIVLDRHVLLKALRDRTGWMCPLPDPADASAVSEMDCARLRALGWTPGGYHKLAEALDEMLITAECAA